MKTAHSFAISLWFAGSAALTPCLAQEAPSIAEVHVDANVVQAPDVRVETHVNSDGITIAPDVRFETHVQPDGVTIVQQRQSVNGRKAELFGALDGQALQNYTVAQAYQNLSTLYSPEMAKKTRDITLLRQMLALKLTARDIEQALPLLRELKGADKIVPAKPEQALDEEYNNLLRAKPGDPMPASSAEALRDAASGFRSRKQMIWDKLGQQIGKEKAAGIRAMLRSESSSVWNSFTPFRYKLTSPQPATPLFQQQRARPPVAPRVRPTQPAPGTEPPNPSDPVSVRPRELDDSFVQPIVAQLVRAASFDPFQDTAPEAAAPRIARPRADRQAAPQADPADEKPQATAGALRQTEREATVAAGQAEREATAAARQAEREVLRAVPRAQGAAHSGSIVLAPQARAMTIDPTGRRVTFGYYGQASLDELIDLMERHLAAMRR